MKQVFKGTGTAPSADIMVPTADQVREEAVKMKSERESVERLMDFKSFESSFDDFDAFQ
jgi:hypothetical protein